MTNIWLVLLAWWITAFLAGGVYYALKRWEAQ